MVEQDEKDKCLEYIERLTDTYAASRMMVQTGNWSKNFLWFTHIPYLPNHNFTCRMDT